MGYFYCRSGRFVEKGNYKRHCFREKSGRSYESWWSVTTTPLREEQATDEDSIALLPDDIVLKLVEPELRALKDKVSYSAVCTGIS